MCEHVFVRWDNLKVDAEEARTLPGYREPATVRTFDAPEALDTRFYEVRAKSALNKVPNASRMPFRWTINPYRGCSHACVYCVWGTTPILMGDGRIKPIADVRAGDFVYGTVRRGVYRRYWVTEVLDHWSTIKPAYRVTLEDGTELVASGDHRFLTARGWKHVTNSSSGPDRAHLTLNDKLIGTGAFAAQPEHWLDYQRGYLCGMIRGDAHLASGVQIGSNGRPHRYNRFRLALTDDEALERTRLYLDEAVGVRARQSAFASLGRRSMSALVAGGRENVAAITEMIEWPRGVRPEWCKGFLAGIFDAEGCHSGALRISNTDAQIIDWTCWSLRALGFQFRIEDYNRANGLRVVRLLGGLREKLRFFHTVDPAITRKREIETVALKNPAKLRVAEIEPLGKGYRLYDITTGTGDFIANGVVSHNCFARPTHTYLDFDAGRDFEKEIVVKVNVPEVARAELMRPSWKREHVALGTNTDPYQWVEGRYRLMPGIWEAMRDSRTPGSVLTKSPLLLRDVELFKQIHEVAGFAANLSIPTLEEKAWRASEPHTPHPRKRIEAVAELNRAGIPTGVLIAPLMPGINDDPRQVEKILELCGEAGAVNIGGIPLHLRGEVREIFFEWLKSYRPDLVERYEELYRRGAYVGSAERERIQALLRPKGERPVSWAEAVGRTGPDLDPVTMPERRAPEEPVQTKLF
jgi:DNA repair photolyase